MSTFVRQFRRAEQEAPAVPTDSNPSESNKRHSSIRLDRVSSKPIRRESKLTIGGLVYIAVTVFLAVGAINSQNNLLFWLFGVAIATLIVSGMFSGNALMQIRLEAQAIPDAFAGDVVRLHYMVSSKSKFFPLFAAMISEIPDDQHPVGTFEPAAILHLGPNQRVKVMGSFTPTRRGRYTVRQMRLSTRFPFGLLQKSLVFECQRSMVILPYQLAIKPELVRVVQGHGEEVRKRTDSSGTSNEYWGLREYVPGDPKRSIAWKPSARRNSLVVIEHAQPIATKLWIWITDPSSSFPNDSEGVERAISLGASLIAHAAKRGVPVGLWAPTLGLRIPPGSGRAHMIRCLRSLATAELSHESLRDSQPQASNTDDVLAIVSARHPISSSGHIRLLSADDPARWLINPDSLPESLLVAQGAQD
jgi:uncharacterized protein (DUF58 family)